MNYYLRTMDAIIKQIEVYSNEINSFIAADAETLEQFRIKFLGVKGIVKAIMGEMKNVPVEHKKSFGQTLNAFKVLAEEKYEAEKQKIESTNIASGFHCPVFQRHPEVGILLH